MRKWQQPAEYTGTYPNGWAGYTFLDYDPNYNVYHPGEDLNWTAGGGGNEDLGRDVWAVQAGKVVYAVGSSAGYGNMVVIEHTLDTDEKKLVKDLYGFTVDKLYSLYAHLNTINISSGATVTKGQKIGTIGNSGTAWAHLHYEISIPDSLDWRFYPTGWSEAKVKTKYLPAFNFIEKTKVTSSGGGSTPPTNSMETKKAVQVDKIASWFKDQGYATDSGTEQYFNNPADPDKFFNKVKAVVAQVKAQGADQQKIDNAYKSGYADAKAKLVKLVDDWKASLV